MARHPFQRLASPSRSLSLILHLLGIASFSYNFYFLTLWDIPITQSYGGHYQFFTIIGLSASLLCFILGAVADITNSSILFQAKNFVSIFTTPLEVVISILYWGLTAIDPKFVAPQEFALPIWPDIGFHLAPAVFLSLDHILFSPPRGISARWITTFSTMFAFAYWYWLDLCFSKNGWYPYPILEILSTPQRMALFTFGALLVTGSSNMLKWLYGRVNGYSEAQKPIKKVQ